MWYDIEEWVDVGRARVVAVLVHLVKLVQDVHGLSKCKWHQREIHLAALVANGMSKAENPRHGRKQHDDGQADPPHRVPNAREKSREEQDEGPHEVDFEQALEDLEASEHADEGGGGADAFVSVAMSRYGMRGGEGVHVPPEVPAHIPTQRDECYAEDAGYERARENDVS